MKKIIVIFLIALALGQGPVALNVHATEPSTTSRGGQVLILDNEKTMTGEVVREGEGYRVKRLVGQTWVPAKRVLKLCASLVEAHRYMQSRANLYDPDERFRLAEWCRQHDLREQALEEVKAALALKPNDRRAKRLLSYLEHSANQAQQPKATATVDPPTPRPDVTAETLSAFASKVQPILMNACLRCHTAGRGGSFQLQRSTGPAMNNRRSLEFNLTAALAEINASEAGASRLLLKAVSVHGRGMTHGPLKNRQAAAYRTLEEWVRNTLASNPNLRERAVASSPPPPAPMPLPVPPPTAVPGNQPAWGADRVNADTGPGATEKPAAKKVDEPADPEAFNREFHPGRKR